MAKVTITIDDANPEIVAVFGPNSLNNIADRVYGYMELVEKTEDELPEKVEKETVNPDGETVTVMEYPEGTEMYKPNPDSRAVHVGKTVLKEDILPSLLRDFSQQVKKGALADAEVQIDQAKDVLFNAAEITTE